MISGKKPVVLWIGALRACLGAFKRLSLHGFEVGVVKP
jgi:hypothetical protein